MIITYARSSSLKNFDYCQHQYFLTYVLGLESLSNLKAEKGTITHKALECLAELQLAVQNGDDNPTIDDETIGKYSCTKDELYEITQLTDEEVDKINKTRVNKDTYKDECFLKYGHKRMGIKVVEELIQLSYDVYTKRSTNKDKFKPVDFKDCTNFTWMALEYLDGVHDPRKMEIVSPEQHFDIPIEHDWAKFEYEHQGQTISGNLAIKGTIDLVTRNKLGILEIVDWKGLPVDTPIPTPTGWNTMGGLKVGDKVFDKDGKITTVIAKSSKNIKPCYQIAFDDNTTVTCDNEHIWTLHDNTVLPITELKVGHKISVTKPLDLPEAPLPIDPYVLGVWLGDGRNKNGEISISEDFIKNEIVRRGYEVGDDISGKEDGCPQYTIYGLRTQLRLLNLLHNKHIPDIYMRASISQRVDLLRGLMDSDGNANPTRKQAVFTNCHKKLSDDVKSLLISLGQRPNQGDVISHGFGVTTRVYPVHFRPINMNPFLLPRKANQIKEEWGPGQSNIRRIINIIEVPETNTQCISVDSPTKTYLCTENMIPTHNTGQRLDWGATPPKLKEMDDFYEDEQLMLYYYAATKIYKTTEIILTIFYIRNGGPFSIFFDESTIEKFEDRLKSKYRKIQRNKSPKLLDYRRKDFRCARLCTYAKNGMCEKVHNDIVKLGMDKAIAKHTREGFNIDHYEAPGE